MAGLTPAAVICEIMKDDGTMARLPDLQVFAREHGLKIGTIADLIHHRSSNESLIERVGSREVATMHGPFMLHAYRDTPSGSPHLALVRGQINAQDETLVRVHEPLTILDMIEVDRSTHTWSVNRSLELLAERGTGVMVLLNCAQSADVQLAQLDAFARIDRIDRISGRRRVGRSEPRGKNRPAHLRNRRADSQGSRRRSHAAAGAAAQDAEHDRFRSRGGRLRARPVRKTT